jgi:Tfp pilus tip-associated adhesin PilY1
MNGDGKLDLVSSVGAVLLGNGDGTFTQAASGFAGDSFVAVGNFGSKQLGIAMIATNEAIVNVYSGNGDGTINQSGKTCSVGQNPRAIAVADFNGDGKADIAVASSFSNSVSIVLGQ